VLQSVVQLVCACGCMYSPLVDVTTVMVWCVLSRIGMCMFV